MYRLTKIFLLLTPFFFISCLDVVEEIELNASKGGKATYTINLSQSKIKLSTLLKLDSLDGHKVPTLYEIDDKLNRTIIELNTKKGISNANYRFDQEEYIITLNLDFSSVSNLDNAIRSLSYWEKSDWKPKNTFYKYADNVFIKHVPQIHAKEKEIQKVEKRKESLKLGSYAFILRNTKGELTTVDQNLRLSGNKKAVLFRKNLYDLSKFRSGFNLEVEVK